MRGSFPVLTIPWSLPAAQYIMEPAVTFVTFPFTEISPADRKSTRLNSSHLGISYAVFCLKKKTTVVTRHPRAVAVFLDRRDELLSRGGIDLEVLFRLPRRHIDDCEVPVARFLDPVHDIIL